MLLIRKGPTGECQWDGGKGLEISLGLPRDPYNGERKVTPSASPKRAAEPSLAIRRFYNESLFTGLSMRYLCWPILRRRASNWNFPKRDSAPSQPLALARFFALDPRLFSPRLESHRDGSFRSTRTPRAVWRNLYAPLHTYISTYLPTRVYVDSFWEG